MKKLRRLMALFLTLAMVLPMAAPMLPVSATETQTQTETETAYAYEAKFSDSATEITQLPDGWKEHPTYSVGTVTQKNGSMFLKSKTVNGGIAAIYFDQADYKDYRVEAELSMVNKTNDSRWMGLTYRMEGDEKATNIFAVTWNNKSWISAYYSESVIDYNGKNLTGWPTSDGKYFSSNVFTSTAHPELVNAAQTKVKLTLDVVGNQIVGYVNDVKVVEAITNNATQETGSFGIATSEADVQVHSYKVTNLTSSYAYEGNFSDSTTEITEMPDGWKAHPLYNNATVTQKDGSMFLKGKASSGISAIYYDQADYTDYRVEAELTMVARNNDSRWMGLTYRMEGDEKANNMFYVTWDNTSFIASYYNATVVGYDGSTITGWSSSSNALFKDYFKKSIFSDTVFPELVGATQTKVKLTVEVVGNQITCYVNDVKVLESVTHNATQETGSFGVVTSGADVQIHSYKVTDLTQMETDTSVTANFSDSSQSEAFSFYSSGTDALTISDGVLKATGSGSELKAILNRTMQPLKSVSVDIIPGESNLINAGIVIGASDVSNAVDGLIARGYYADSRFTGWADAPNRIDIIEGAHNNNWKQLSRTVSETVKGNALYKNGVKEAINMRLDFDTDHIMLTLSLVSNPAKYIQQIYYCDTTQITGQIGIRSFKCDASFDNFKVEYMTEDAPEESVQKDGFSFREGKLWKTSLNINEKVRTVDAWIKVPKETGDNCRLTVVSAYPTYDFGMAVYENGKPGLWYLNSSGTAVRYLVDMDIRNNQWTHVAWVCDDAAGVVKCYINGKSVYTNNTLGDGLILPFLRVGTDNRSGWKYPFIGKIADIRVWNKPLTAEEVKTSMNTSDMQQAEGLLLNLPLKEASNTKTLQDVSGNKNNVSYERIETWIDVEKKESDYSIAIIPDQQMLTNHYPEKLTNMYQWIADNIESENIQAVLGVGDITDGFSIIEFERAREAYALIEGKVPFLPVPGNHDYDWTKTYRDLTNMNTYFPVSLLENQGLECGFYSRDKGLEDDSANYWQAFEVMGNKYLVVALEFGPRDSVLEWANEVVAAHPDHQTIITTHGYMYWDGTRLDGQDGARPSSYSFLLGESEQPNDADGMWDKLVRKHENIIMVLSGHILSSDHVVKRVDKGDNGNEVIQFLIDGQQLDLDMGGLGLVAMMNFSNDGQDVEFTYYSTDRGMYWGEVNQFSFTLPEQKKTYVAQVGETTYTTVTEAAAAANGQVVTILADTNEEIEISANVTIDLAGCKLSNVTVVEGVKLNLIDSTADYAGTKGSATVTGTVESLVEHDGKKYMVIGENGVYAPHRYYVGITNVSLAPNVTGFGYKAEFYGDAAVQAQIANIGFDLWLTEDRVISKTTGFKNTLTLRLKNFMVAQYGETPVNAKVFITLTDGTKLESAIHSYSMRDVVEEINDTYEKFDTDKLQAVAAMIQNNATMQAWTVANIVAAVTE